MVAPQNLKFQPQVANIDLDGNMRKPRCSLDFVIRLPEGGTIGDDYVRIQSFSGQESISQPFEYKVELRANDRPLSAANCQELDLSKLIGSDATIRVGLPASEESSERQYPDADSVAFFNGVISSFSFKQSGVYECVLRPKLWKLGLSNDYRLYADKTIKNLISEIVHGKHKVECDVEGLVGSALYRTQDWLQAGESDLDFVNQLLSKVNGYYYFSHDDSSHKLVFANTPAYVNIPPPPSHTEEECVPLYYTFSKQTTLDEDDRLLDFTYDRHLVPSGSRNILAQPEAAWQEQATASLTVHEQASSDKPAFKHYRVFQYGVTQEEAAELNSREEAIIKSDAVRLNGQSTCPRLKPGHVFRTVQYKDSTDTPREDVALMRPEMDGLKFVVLTAQHQADIAGNYNNGFTAASAAGDVIEHDPRRSRMGSVYGRVVRENGSVEAVRKHGMMEKNNFAFDSKDFSYSEPAPENEGNPPLPTTHSCKGVFVEFPGLKISDEDKPVWVKLAEHMQSVPEEGVTVLVSRSSDDTEVPEIQSIVQQKGTQTILPPDETVENTSVGNNYSVSYGDSRSIRYGTKSTVNLDSAINHVDAQFATGKFRDASYSLGASYSYSAPNSANDMSGLLSRSVSYGNTFSEYYGGRSESKSKIGVSKSESTVDESYSTSVVNAGTSDSTTTLSRSDSKGAIGLVNSTDAKGLVNSASATAAVNSAAVTGVSNSVDVRGVVNSAAATGVANSAAATGVTNSASVTGVANSASVTAVSNSNNTIGTVNSTDIVGASNTLRGVGQSSSVSVSLMVNDVSKQAGTHLSIGLGLTQLGQDSLSAHQHSLVMKVIAGIQATV